MFESCRWIRSVYQTIHSNTLKCLVRTALLVTIICKEKKVASIFLCCLCFTTEVAHGFTVIHRI